MRPTQCAGDVAESARRPPTVLECGGTRIEVRGTRRADVVWLEEFVAPAFRVSAEAKTVDCRVEAILDRELHDVLRASRPPGPLPEPVAFVLDQGALRVVEWRAQDGARVLADDVHGVVHVVSPGAVRIVGAAPGRRFRCALLRVVRELFASRVWSGAGALLHAGAFALEGRALLLAGPKRSGKTSLLIHCIHAHGARYLANDRVWLGSEDGGLHARGLPTYINVRHGTLALFPELERRLSDGGIRAHLRAGERDDAPPDPALDLDGVKLTPPQLARLVGAQPLAGAPLGAMLLPRVDLAERGLDVRRLSPEQADARLEDALFAATSAATISEVFAAAGEAGFDRLRARAWWERAVRAVPVFECRIGQGAFDVPASEGLLRPVLGALEGAAAASASAPVHPEVSAELARLRLEVVACHRVSQAAVGRTRRHTYRVALADGRTLKVRRALGEERAREVFELLGALSHPRIARVLSRNGSVLIEEWVDGEALPEAEPPPARVREAAGVLASLHGVTELAGRTLHGEAHTEEHRLKAERELARLAELRVLAVRDAESLRAALRRTDPGRARTGLVHLDFCLENMVVDREDRLRLVDNESVSLDAFDFDLARTWYRSELADEAWDEFMREYRRQGGPAGRERGALFWRIAAVAEGALRRVEFDPARSRMPLERLRELAASQ